MGLHDFTFYDLIHRNAVAFGHRPAWYEADDGRTLTFAQIRAEVDRLAAGLQQRGLAKGDRVGVLGKNSLAYFLVYGAAAALGAIVLPVNWRLSADEACFNLSDGAPKVLFADHEYHRMVQDNRDRLSSVTAWVGLDAGGGDFENFGGLAADPAGLVPADVGSDDGFVIIHTAAVGGRPRGALLTHGNVMCADLHWSCCLRLTPEDVHLNFLPLFHVAGLFMATAGFHAGALNVNMGRFDAQRAARLIQEKRVSFFFDFSPILSSVLDEQEKAGADLSSLRAVVGIDTPEAVERYQALTGGTFYSMYGQTETSSVATYGRYDDCPGSAGRVIPLAGVRLVDDDDRPVAAGQAGEIAVKGPMVFSGYWNLPEETARAFRGGWHHTGDLGRFDADGFLFFAGRKAEKELIKPGGENVYPAEVEKAILAHPSVEKTVVFGVPDPKWKEGIKAVCVLTQGAALTAEELIRFVGDRIAGYKKPRYVQFVDHLPELPDGSPDRAKVKAAYGGGPV